MQKLTNDEFVARAKAVHRGKYGYGSVVYTHSQVKIVIACPVHGDFEQTPVEHLRGRGCMKCGWAGRRKS